MLPLPPEDLEHVLAHTESVWRELRGERLFITGGTGFFGIWLLETLAWANERTGAGIRATILSRDPTAFAAKLPHLAACPDFVWHRGDVRDFSTPAGTFGHIIHAATESSAKLNAEQPLSMLDTIIGGTRRVLDFAVSAGARNVLLTSSGAVYGRLPAELTHVAEDYRGGPDVNSPASAYAEGKRVAEQLCSIYFDRHGLRPKIARCFAFVGPHLPLDAHFAIGNFIGDALAGRQIIVRGDGRPYRSYLYAADLAIWLWTIFTQGETNRPYNVGSAEALDISELARMIASHGNPPARVKVSQPPGAAPPERYVPDVRRAESELGLSPTIALPEAIARTLLWHRRHT